MFMPPKIPTTMATIWLKITIKNYYKSIRVSIVHVIILLYKHRIIPKVIPTFNMLQHRRIVTIIIIIIIITITTITIIELAKMFYPNVCVATGVPNWNCCVMYRLAPIWVYTLFPIIHIILVATRPRLIWKIVSINIFVNSRLFFSFGFSKFTTI